MKKSAKKSASKKTAPEEYMSPEALMTAVNHEFGENTLVRASEAVGLIKKRFSTGSFALDLVLHGGSPEGGIEIIEGERTSGKSWGLMSRARCFLDKHAEGVFILVNAEGTNDPDFLSMLRVPLDRTYILSPDSGEQAWDAAVFVAKRAKKVYLGIDSLDAMVPMSELSADMDQSSVALAARMNNKGFRKLVNAMRSDLLSSDQRVTACFITQLRTNIGIMFGDPNTSVGGKGKEFAASQIIRMKRKAYVRTEGAKLIDRITFGIVVSAHIHKSKGCGEGEQVEYTLYKENYKGFKRGEIDNVTELVPFLLRYEIVKKKGSWYTLPNEDRVQGDEGLADYLREYKEMLDYCQEEVKAVYAQRYALPAEETKEEPQKRRRSRRRKAR
ncbi:MAG: hypothetical protein GF334_06460 [Candidatus Altiarchaeales archaeon]|nr:hypothetical protein [Candidatus Altiarchaeales archaeon]